MSESGKNRRDRAAAASAAAQSEEKRRERIVRIVGGATVIVVVLGIIGVAVVVKNQAKNDAANPTPTDSASLDPGAPTPKGVFPAGDPYAFGVPVGTAAATAPVLQIWEDFQCPACEAVEKANGAGIQALAADGKVQLIYRITTFLDRNLGNDASSRATAAWGCAIDAGKTTEYHNAIYANPPVTEGDGFTDDQLVTFASDAGITGAALDTFKKCYADRTYIPWGANSADIFYSSNIAGTPFALLNGVEVPTKDLADPAALEALVAAAAAAPAPSASPAASASAS